VPKDDKHVILSAATHASPPSLSTTCGPTTKSLMPLRNTPQPSGREGADRDQCPDGQP
jgi:hypothetical protein